MSPLDRARRKAYRRIIPLVFASYVIAYIDRTNVALAKLTMSRDLGFDNDVFGAAFGIFFLESLFCPASSSAGTGWASTCSAG